MCEQRPLLVFPGGAWRAAVAGVAQVVSNSREWLQVPAAKGLTFYQDFRPFKKSASGDL